MRRLSCAPVLAYFACVAQARSLGHLRAKLDEKSGAIISLVPYLYYAPGSDPPAFFSSCAPRAPALNISSLQGSCTRLWHRGSQASCTHRRWQIKVVERRLANCGRQSGLPTGPSATCAALFHLDTLTSCHSHLHFLAAFPTHLLKTHHQKRAWARTPAG